METLAYVNQDDLKKHLDDIPDFSFAEMVQGNMYMKKDRVQKFQRAPGLFGTYFVARHEKLSFRKKAVPVVWVAKTTLQCNGAGNCLRKCGGMGRCADDCTLDKSTRRGKYGHNCYFKVMLKMYSNKVGVWEVHITGEHVLPIDIWHPPAQNPLTIAEVKEAALDAYDAGIKTPSAISAALLSQDIHPLPSLDQLKAFVYGIRREEPRYFGLFGSK